MDKSAICRISWGAVVKIGKRIPVDSYCDWQPDIHRRGQKIGKHCKDRIGYRPSMRCLGTIVDGPTYRAEREAENRKTANSMWGRSQMFCQNGHGMVSWNYERKCPTCNGTLVGPPVFVV